MAYTIDYGYTRSAESNTLSIPKPLYVDWSVSEETRENGAQKQRTWTNMTSPVDRQAELRVFNRSLRNAYASTDINVVNQAPIKTGLMVGVDHTAVIKVEPADTSCCEQPIYVPMECTISMRSLKHPAIDASVYKQFLLDTINKCFDENVIDETQLNAWIHGSLTLNVTESGGTDSASH